MHMANLYLWIIFSTIKLFSRNHVKIPDLIIINILKMHGFYKYTV